MPAVVQPWATGADHTLMSTLCPAIATLLVKAFIVQLTRRRSAKYQYILIVLAFERGRGPVTTAPRPKGYTLNQANQRLPRVAQRPQVRRAQFSRSLPGSMKLCYS